MKQYAAYIQRKKETKKKLGKNNNEMESNTITITDKHYKQERMKVGKLKASLARKKKEYRKTRARSCKLVTKESSKQ